MQLTKMLSSQGR